MFSMDYRSIGKQAIKDFKKYVEKIAIEFEEKIDAALHKAVYNVGSGAKVGAKYILGQIASRKKK